MDIEKLKSSGELELYVLGLCDAPRQQEITALVAGSPELQEEVRQLEETLRAYAEAAAPPADPYQQRRLLATLEQEAEKEAEATAEKEKQDGLIRRLEGKTRQLQRRWQWTVAASLLLLFTGVGALWQYHRFVQTQEGRVARLQHDQEQLAHLNSTQQEQLASLENDNTLLRHDMKKVVLQGLPLAPASKGMVYFDPAQRLTFLEINNLPANPSGMQYQLWAIVSGKPMDLGVFDATDFNHLHPMKKLPGAAQAFAVTLEKKGGSENPTLSQMYVMGKVG